MSIDPRDTPRPADDDVAQLKRAIDANDVGRVPWEAPGPARLAMAAWMIAHGSDVHQGGDGPLMRAALNDDRIPMMGLLVEGTPLGYALRFGGAADRPTVRLLRERGAAV
jgi:hypothetical protein